MKNKRLWLSVALTVLVVVCAMLILSRINEARSNAAPVTIWLDPYRAITNANYYNRLVGAQGGPRIYEGSFTDIPNDPQS